MDTIRETALKNKTAAKTGQSRLWGYRYAYLLILPAILLVFVFSYLPLAGIVIAFKDYDILNGIAGSPWVGLKHFKTIVSAPDMLKAIGNTFVYGCVILFGAFPFPVILALMFNELRNVMFKKITQTVSYVMYFLSWISVVGMVYSFLALEGPLNQMLAAFAGEGFAPVNYLLESKNFLPILFVTHLWKNCGWSSVIFLAAIAGIDSTLYEAARVDGCGKWKQMWHVTLPGIKSTVIIVLIMSLGTMVSVNFEQVYGFQNVFTQKDTEVIGTLIYRMGIGNGAYSLSSAFGLAQGGVSLLLLIISNWFSKKIADISII